MPHNNHKKIYITTALVIIILFAGFWSRAQVVEEAEEAPEQLPCSLEETDLVCPPDCGEQDDLDCCYDNDKCWILDACRECGTTCVDDDGGPFYHTAGTLSLTSGFTIGDYCEDESTLMEMRCTGMEFGWSKESRACEHGCAEGACLCPEPYFRVSAAGECVWNCGPGTTPDPETNECVCRPGFVEAGEDDLERLVCEYTEETVCRDTDGGKDLYAFGQVIDRSDGPLGDVCLEDGEAAGRCVIDEGGAYCGFEERYCGTDGKMAVSRYMGEDFKRACPHGCADGACIMPEVMDTCIDREGGKDLFSAGSVLNEGAVYEESCLDRSRVNEYWCEEGDHYSTVYTCLYGCYRGVCLSAASSTLEVDGFTHNHRSGDLVFGPHMMMFAGKGPGEPARKSAMFLNEGAEDMEITLRYFPEFFRDSLSVSGGDEFILSGGQERVDKQFTFNAATGTLPGRHTGYVKVMARRAGDWRPFENKGWIDVYADVAAAATAARQQTESNGQEEKDGKLRQRLGGRILIKVEDSGRAYYVHPQMADIHYLGRPADAFTVMREQGVGITDRDLNKIQPAAGNPAGDDADGDGLPDIFEEAVGTDPEAADTDGDGFSDRTELDGGYDPLSPGNRLEFDPAFSAGQAGRILLRVEARGEAWYVNPEDGKRYFLGRPRDAFSVMRNLGLGISNQDFSAL